VLRGLSTSTRCRPRLDQRLLAQREPVSIRGQESDLAGAAVLVWVSASVWAWALVLAWEWELPWASELESVWASESELVSALASRSASGPEMRKRVSVWAAAIRLARDSASVTVRKEGSQSAPA
jgi:hypothetical protein